MTDLSVPPVAAPCSPTPSTCCSRPAASTTPRSRACSRRSTRTTSISPTSISSIALRELEPRGRHRQVGHVHHRPRRRRARGDRRQAGLRVLRRHLARRARTKRRSPCARSGARDSPPSRRSVASARARSLYAPADPGREPCRSGQGRAARAARAAWRARAIRASTQVMASLAGEHETCSSRAATASIAADVRPLVRVSITVIVEENGRREQGYAGGGGRFDYAYFTDAVLDAYATQAVGAGGAQSRRARRAGGHDDRRARPRLAGHPAARGDRPRPRRRLQPQGHERVLGPRRPARRGARASPSSTTARSTAGAARSTSTTKAIRRSAPC